jgi:hypothetical protein
MRRGGEYLSLLMPLQHQSRHLAKVEHAIHNLDSQHSHFIPFAVPEQGLARPFNHYNLAPCLPQPDNLRSALRRAHPEPACGPSNSSTRQTSH